jgi:hypothetical protein
VASSTRLGARRCGRGAVSRLAAADSLVGEVGLLPVPGSDAVQSLLGAGVWAVGRPGGGALRAMGTVRGTGMRLHSAGGRGRRHGGGLGVRS